MSVIQLRPLWVAMSCRKFSRNVMLFGSHQDSFAEIQGSFAEI